MRRLTVALGMTFAIVAVAPASASAATISYGAVLGGDAVVTDSGQPNQGDPDGRASYSVDLDPAAGEACVSSAVAGLAPPTAARVHAGAAGTNGPPAFDLPTPPLGNSEVVCSSVDPALLAPVIADPGSFYLLITTDEHPDGAVRGQLFLSMCHLFGWGPDQVEGSETVFIFEGQEVQVGGWFPAGGHVTVTVSREGQLVSTDVHEIAENPEVGLGVLEMFFSFADGDDGVWTITAEDPAVGDCVSSIEVTVGDSLSSPPEDGGPTGGATTGGPTLPDTAAAPVPPGPLLPMEVIGAGLLLLAIGSLSVIAMTRPRGRSPSSR